MLRQIDRDLLAEGSYFTERYCRERKKLRVNNIKKDFKDVEALKGISFEFEAPSFVGVIGHNGSGKL